ncbi:MAG: hypothetical protein Q7T82_12595 [Armatimonadota bacterium]|nr:hypothetical protein [Armatimonadota bacterium]
MSSITVTGSSDGITVAPAMDTIAAAKALADTSPAALYGKTVTAVFPDCAYVQERHGQGVRIVTGQSISLNDVVDLAGTMTGSDKEKQLAADTVVRKTTGGIGPVAFPGEWLGGHAFQYDPVAQTGQQEVRAYTAGVLSELSSINNVGMLVTVLGRVTYSDTNGFYVDDGSGFSDFAQSGPDYPTGIKVTVPSGVATPAGGSYVVVTGISSVYQAGGSLRRLLLVRQQSDIVTF